jgi:putative PIN family toxin of toxin-antitoxin system
MRLVFDSNVLIAAFSTRGLCHAVLESCLIVHELVVSEVILKEVGRKLRTKMRVPAAVAEEIDQFLRAHAVLVEPTSVSSKVCRDKKDLPVLGTAEAGNAAFLVTGDSDLLDVRVYAETKIVTPRELWEQLRTRRPQP